MSSGQESAKMNSQMSKSPGEVAVDQAIESAGRFLNDNPAFAVAGAALLTQALAALSRSSPIRKSSSRAALRDWLSNSCETLPDKKQFVSAAKSDGLPTSYQEVKRVLLSRIEKVLSDGSP